MGNEAILRVDGLSKTYGAFTAVQGLSLEVKRGEVLGFLGPNGAGKTTSINMMCGLLKPTAGTVYLKGKPMTASSSERLNVGLCPQQIVVWDRLSCIEQLVFIGEMYGLDAITAKTRGKKLLEMLGLSEKTKSQASQLSGGMQRRLNIALALIHDPEIVVFDEPEAGLDPQSRVLVRDFITSLADNKAVILTTHNMDEADRVASRVAIIDKGKILVVNTPDKLKRDIGDGNIIEIQIGVDELDDDTKKKITAKVESMNARGKILQDRLVVEGERTTELVAPLLTALNDMRLAVGSVIVRQPTLEDVFLQLTGRSLRE
jgi:ABC-2 type transport system ATP-binding protein